VIYDCRKLDWSAELEIWWANSTFRHESGIWRNFAMTSPETLNMKLSANELIFPLVTHTVNSDVWFDSYGIFKSGQGVEHFLDRLVMQVNGQV
jgi:hypothetical protein